MNRTDRLAEIKKIVEQRGRVEVSELSAIFGVSEVMIRKDLTILEQRKCLKRAYGAALLIDGEEDVPAAKGEHLGIEIEYDKKKEDIGRVAATLVKDDGWIFIGQGITCYYVAREIAKLGAVNVLTNNFWVAHALSNNKYANVVFTGGNLVHNYMYVAGEMFARYLENLHITQAFMGVGGADMSAGYTVNDPTEQVVYQAIKEIADELIIVVDSAKFDKKTFLSLGKLNLSDVVISDGEMPQRYIDHYEEIGVKVLNY